MLVVDLLVRCVLKEDLPALANVIDHDEGACEETQHCDQPDDQAQL